MNIIDWLRYWFRGVSEKLFEWKIDEMNESPPYAYGIIMAFFSCDIILLSIFNSFLNPEQFIIATIITWFISLLICSIVMACLNWRQFYWYRQDTKIVIKSVVKWKEEMGD